MRFNRRDSSGQQMKPDAAEPGDAGEKEPLTLVEERLQTLVERERGSRDLLAQREAERQANEKAEAERRVAEVEAALGEARAHKHELGEAQRKLAEMEKALTEGWAEIKRISGELSEAKREAEQARKEIKPRSERMVAEAQQGLANARAEAERERQQRVETERKLVALEQSERKALETLERELTAAHANEAAETELRIAELEELLAEANAEAARQREQRAEIERRLEAQVALEADARQTHERQLEELEGRRAEAERAATEAHEEMRSVRAERNDERERLLAIEQQLQALVAPNDSALPVREYGQGDSGHGDSESMPPEPPAPSLDDRFGVEEGDRVDDLEPEETRVEPEEVTAEELVETRRDQDAASRSDPPRRSGRRGRRQSRKQTWACAVCGSTAEWQSASALKASGWTITGGAALCPDCKRVGWQLPEGGGLPFRRSSEKQTSS